MAMTPRLASGRVRACSRTNCTTFSTSAPTLSSEPTPRYVWHEVVREGRRASRAWERHEPVTVDVAIRKGDERFVAASVVPVERPRRLEKCGHDVEDALEPSDFGGLVLVDFPFSCREESCRRKLVSVAGDDGLSPAEQGCGGILGQDLACLIKNDDVEEGSVRWNQLADGKRAGHPARAKRQKHFGGFAEQLAQGQVARLLLGLARHDAVLVAMLIADRNHPFSMGAPHTIDANFQSLPIQLPELLYQVVMASPAERRDRGILPPRLVKTGTQPRVREHVAPETGRWL